MRVRFLLGLPILYYREYLMSESLLKYLNQKIKESDDNLDIELEERGLSKDTGTYSDLGLDEDGIPNSHGNSDDVYNDGFNYGHYQGYYDCLVELKTYLEN